MLAFGPPSHSMKHLRGKSTLFREAVLVFTTAVLVFLYATPADVANPLAANQQAPDSQAARRRLLSEPAAVKPALVTTSRPTKEYYERHSDGPQQANIAYFLQIAESTAGHLPRLLRRIHHPQNVYAIHFDLKMSDEMIQSVKNAIWSANPEFEKNVHFMPSELITYRGVSMVLNTINAMNFLLEKDDSWDYFINLSGSDYPLIKAERVRQMLGQHVADRFNFVTLASPSRWAENIKYRIRNFYTDEALAFGNGPSKVLQSSQVNPLVERMKFEYVNSEAWMINSREFCHFVVTDGYARKMLLTFAFSVEASEHYFSTMLWNHPEYNTTIVQRSMRHVIWHHGERTAGQHPFSVDEVQADGSFTFQKVAETSPHFFIRKFAKPNSPLMDIIDNRMEHPERIATVNKHFKWITGLALREREAKLAAKQNGR